MYDQGQPMPLGTYKSLQTTYKLSKRLGIILLVILILATCLCSFFFIESSHHSEGFNTAAASFVTIIVLTGTLYLFIILPIAAISLLVLIIQLIKLRKARLLNWHYQYIKTNLIVHLLIIIPAVVYAGIRLYFFIQNQLI